MSDAELLAKTAAFEEKLRKMGAGPPEIPIEEGPPGTKPKLFTEEEAKGSAQGSTNNNGFNKAFGSTPAPGSGPIIADPKAPDDEEIQGGSNQAYTQLMILQQKQVALQKKQIEQNNLLHQLVLKKNQNQVLAVNPNINQSADIAVFQRREVEAHKFKVEEFERTYAASVLANKQQQLTRQAYANYHWGIPSAAGDVNGSPEYFRGSY